MKTTVIVPVWNGRRYLERCFTALLAQRTWAGEAPELIAVDLSLIHISPVPAAPSTKPH